MSEATFEALPLSVQQRRLAQQGGDRESFCAQVAWAVDGQPEVGRLRQALEAAVEEHEILRTTFRRRPGMKIPFQVVGDSNAVAWSEGQAEDGVTVDEYLRRERQKPQDFEMGPLLRAHCLTHAEGVWLLVTLPSLTADAISLDLLAAEVVRFYADPDAAGDDEEGAVQYADYGQWQEELLETEDEDQEAGLDHWRRQDFSALTELRPPLWNSVAESQAPRPSDGEYGVVEVDWQDIGHAPAEVLDRLKSRATAFETSPTAVALAAWQTLLWRLDRRDDLGVSVVVDGRSFEDLEGALGPYARAVPVGGAVRGDAGIEGRIRDLHRALAEAVEWQDFAPWEGEGDSVTVPSRPVAAFELVELSNVHSGDDLSLKALDAHTLGEHFGVKWSLTATDRGLVGRLWYDPRNLTSDAAERLAGQAARFLTLAVDPDNDRAVGQWPLLSDDETAIRGAWGEGKAPDPNVTGVTLHEHFRRWVDADPSAPAVTYEGETFDRATLQRRADRVSTALLAAGLRPEEPVPLVLHRSADVVAALLGVMQAGGAYVPLDPELPVERLRFMLDDLGAKRVLVHRDLTGTLPDSVDTLVLDDLVDDPAEDASPELPTVSLDQLAYLLYTSGSTGQPKAVAVAHRQVSHYLAGALDRLDLGDGAAYAMVSTFVADLGNTCLFPALATGGHLHVMSQDRASDPVAFAETMAGQGIDALKIVPSHLAALLSVAEEPTRLLPRRVLVLGGEAMAPDLLGTLAEHAPEGSSVLNHYGPTETTVGVTTHPVDLSVESPATPPLGAPLLGTRLTVVDPSGEAVSVGVGGELRVSGPAVSRGYHGRPAATAERFIPDPQAPEPGGRSYRTGDLVRFDGDGALHFSGRVDHQVKIRGFRLELGEVEAELRTSDGVADAVAGIHSAASGEDRLVAWLVPRRGASIDDEALRQRLTARLPDYMVPAAMVSLDRLPLTANGKVDRRALPEPEQAIRRRGETVPPRTPVERVLANTWKEFLRIDDIGIHDNFFELGGDSILAIQVVARANQEGLSLYPKLIFDYQTIAELAERVDEGGDFEAAEQGEVTGPVPLTSIQRWFFDGELTDRHHWNMSELLPLPDGLSEGLGDALDFLWAHHDALRLGFEPTPEGNWRSINAPTGDGMPRELVDLSGLDTQAQREAIAEHTAAAQSQFGLAGPLVKAVIFHGLDGGDRLFLAVHHLVVDGVSWRILIDDLTTLSGQVRAGQELSLPLKTTSFKRWAEGLQDLVGSGALDDQAEYWLDAVQTEIPELPVDHPDGSSTVGTTEALAFGLKAEQTTALLQDVPQVYRTRIDEVLLTALGLTLAKAFDQPVLVNLEGHGRESLLEGVDTSRTVGWFTSHYPFLLDLRGTDDLGDALRKVQAQRRAVPDEGVGFGLLRWLESTSSESLASLPQASISFNYLGRFDNLGDAAGGATGAPVEAAAKTPDEAESAAGEPTAADGDSPPPIAESLAADRSAAGERRLEIEVNTLVDTQGKLTSTWTYGTERWEKDQIFGLGLDFVGQIRGLIRHCMSIQDVDAVPEDFPLAGLDVSDLDAVAALLDDTDGENDGQ